MTSADRQRFDRLIGMVLEHEGGYVCDPFDPGGATKFGICQRSYPKLDIKNLTEQQACDIYYRDWWKPLRCSDIRNDQVAQKLLDTCINVGPTAGVKILQRAICDTGPQVTIDGIIGPQTLDACNRVDPDRLLAAMRTAQAEHYKRLIKCKPGLAKYEKGWLRRAAS